MTGVWFDAFFCTLKMATVFISYKEEDADIAVAAANTLEEKGYSTWYYQRDQKGGVSYLKQIESEIGKCKAFLLIISAPALSSEQVTKEVVRAHEGRKAFIPLLVGLSHAEFQDLQPEWRMALGATVSIPYSPRNPELALRRITDGLSALSISPELPIVACQAGVAPPARSANQGGSAGQDTAATQIVPARPSQPLAGLQAPRPVQFGLQDCFHSTLDWRLNSPVLVAWVCTDSVENSAANGATPIAITIVGEGLPEVRQQIETAAHSASVHLGAGGMNMITRGFIHLSLPELEATQDKPSGVAKLLALMGVGGAQPGVAVAGGASAKQAFVSFVKLLREIESTVGCLKIHDVSQRDFMSRLSYLRRQVSRANTSQPIVVAPRRDQKLMVPFPIPIFRAKRPRLSVPLPADLLKNPELSALMEAYYGSILTQLMAAVERRIEFFRDEVDSDRAAVEWFRKLPPADRAKVKDVYANRMVDFELAIELQVEGTVIPPATYYLDHLPHKVLPRKEIELKHLEEMRQPLKELRGNRDSALWHNCLSRCFDCALRNVQFSDDGHLNDLYEAWRVRVTDVLVSSWRRFLESHKLAEADIFKRTVVFHTTSNPSPPSLEMTPYALIDSSRTTVVIEYQQNTVQVLDPLDDALFRRADAEEISDDAELVVAKLASLPNDKNASREMKEVAFGSPGLPAHVCRSLSRQTLPLSRIDSLRGTVSEAMLACTTGTRYVRLLTNLMYNTADDLIEPLRNATDLMPNQALCLLILACYAEQLEPSETIRCLYEKRPVHTSEKIGALFRAASAGGDALLWHYLLTNQIPAEAPNFTPAEMVAAKIERVLEAVDIYAEFDRGIRSLQITGESLESIFFKTATAFEVAHRALWANPTPTSTRIQFYLTGEPLPKHLS